jgi:hypothetical protein
MSQINIGGVLKGGLVAGLIMNVSEFLLHGPVAGAQLTQDYSARNIAPVAGGQVGQFIIMTFLLGLLTIWLYAAIRPRFGAGPGTAIAAGLFMWSISHLRMTLTLAILGMHGMGLVVLWIVWSAIEMIVAASVGAYLYTES